MRRLVLLVLALGLISAAPALAVPYNNTQVGSLLVFPDVRFDGAFTTVIRITNTSDSLGVSVACYWMDRNKDRNAITFDLTHNQPIVFDPSLYFSDTSIKRGELKCFAVNGATGAQIVFNQLIGSATIIDYDSGAAYEYTAAAFGARAGAAGEPGTILLNNTNYDACYQYLYGQITQTGQAEPGGAVVLQNRVAFASCIQDLTQDFTIHTTKLVYEIWNAGETKFGNLGTIWDCADSWHETILGTPGYWNSQNLSTFVNPNILLPGTEYLAYRVSTVVSTQCQSNYPAAWLPGPKVAGNPGLIGIQSTVLTVPAAGGDVIQAVGTNLNGKGSRTNGVIRFLSGSESQP
jgi:hypothetical protein